MEIVLALLFFLALLTLFNISRLGGDIREVSKKMSNLSNVVDALVAKSVENTAATQTGIALITELITDLNEALASETEAEAQVSRIQKVLDEVEAARAALQATVDANPVPQSSVVK